MVVQTKKNRLDKFLASHTNFSRNKIIDLINKKLVKVNNKIIEDKSYLIGDKDKITIEKTKIYVSRAAYKLLYALDHYKINLKDKVCLDIGCSTGGFTQVMLESKAKFVYAIDVGYKQFNRNLLSEKVCLKEKTNFLNLNSNDFKQRIDFIACDVSFVSITKMITHINKIFSYPFKLVCLIKPEFELTPKIMAKSKGYVNSKYHNKVIKKILSLAKKLNFKIYDVIKSPILGAKKNNIEFLVLLEKNNE